MKPALIKLTKKITLKSNIKHNILRKIYSDSVSIVIELLDNSSFKSWENAIAHEHVEKNIHTELNSDSNRNLKRINKNYTDLYIGPNNSIVSVYEGKIQVLSGKIEDPKSFEFTLYLTLQEFTLLNCFGNSILVSIGNQIENLLIGVDAFLLQLNDEYNIVYYQTPA